MRVTVDGIVFENQAHGGVSRVYQEILPRMCNLDPALAVDLWTGGHLRQPLPVHAQIRSRRQPGLQGLLRPSRLWRETPSHLRVLIQHLALGSDRRNIWHSTYYTLPRDWRGPNVVTVLDMTYERLPHLFSTPADDRFRRQKRRCVMAADAVICISAATREDLVQLYDIDAGRCEVVPLAHSDVFKPVAIPADGRSDLPDPFLLYVGSRDHYKNFDLLLTAYSRWRGRADVHLVVVGRGWRKTELARLSELGVEERVHLLQSVDDYRLCLLYNQALGFVYPSLYEGFGIPLLEAMACGCPVLASRIPTTLEVADDCPLYFDPADGEALLAALDALCGLDRGAPGVQQGQQRAALYTWDRAARQTLAIYHALTKD